jgi:hypothetical protein
MKTTKELVDLLNQLAKEILPPAEWDIFFGLEVGQPNTFGTRIYLNCPVRTSRKELVMNHSDRKLKNLLRHRFIVALREMADLCDETISKLKEEMNKC